MLSFGYNKPKTASIATQTTKRLKDDNNQEKCKNHVKSTKSERAEVLIAPRPEFLDEFAQYQQHMFGTESPPTEIDLDFDTGVNVT